MLEWYRVQANLKDFIEETIQLVEFCTESLAKKGHDLDQELKKSSFVIKTVEEIFLDFLNLPILDYLVADSLKKWILLNRPHLIVDKDELWPYEDYFFLLFLNEIEPHLGQYPKLILKEYPAPLAALSTLSEINPRVCLRFELYLNGVEVANCFQEECSSQIIKNRFDFQNKCKKQLYGYSLKKAQRFLEVMERGIPASSGIALGVERLAGLLCNQSIPFWD